MAEEPQPSNIQDGATEDAPAVPASGEERKTAAAMSKLEEKGDDDATQRKDVDTEALGKAMKDLDVSEKAPEQKTEVKKVKIEAVDVTLVVRLRSPMPGGQDRAWWKSE